VDRERAHAVRLAAGVRAFSVHPGAVMTELVRFLPDEELRAIVPADWAATSKNPEQGAATSVWCAFVSPADEVGGRYCEDCHVAGPAGEPGGSGGVNDYALDPSTATALWARSEELVGESFPD